MMLHPHLADFARVFPRRKAGENARSNSQPIVLSRQALEPLFDRPLREAAICLGLSGTALKTICRKLRIERWPFQQSRWLQMRAGKIGQIGACEEAIPPSTIPASAKHSSKQGRAAFVLGENVRARKTKSGITFSKHATLKSKNDAKRFMNKFKAWHGDDYDEGLDDGSVFGSLEMSYNSPPSSPRPVREVSRNEKSPDTRREVSRHKKLPDTSYTASPCSVTSTVASLTRTVSAPAVTTPQYPVQRRTSQQADNLSLSFMALHASRPLSAAPTHLSSYLPGESLSGKVSQEMNPLMRLGNEHLGMHPSSLAPRQENGARHMNSLSMHKVYEERFLSSRPAIPAINSWDTSQPRPSSQPKIIQDCHAFLSVRNSNQDTTSESDPMDYSTACDLSYLVCGIDHYKTTKHGY